MSPQIMKLDIPTSRSGLKTAGTNSTISIWICACTVYFGLDRSNLISPITNGPQLVEGSLEVKLPTIWTDESTDGKSQREEKSRREKIREEKESEERRCRCAKR